MSTEGLCNHDHLHYLGISDPIDYNVFILVPMPLFVMIRLIRILFVDFDDLSLIKAFSMDGPLDIMSLKVLTQFNRM